MTPTQKQNFVADPGFFRRRGGEGGRTLWEPFGLVFHHFFQKIQKFGGETGGTSIVSQLVKNVLTIIYISTSGIVL